MLERTKTLCSYGGNEINHLHPTSITLAVLGDNTVVAEILELLLQEAGYNTLLLSKPAVDNLDQLLVDAQLLILTPPRDVARRKAFLSPAMSGQAMAKIPVLELLTVPEDGTQTRLGDSIGWPCRIERLTQKIEETLLLAGSPPNGTSNTIVEGYRSCTEEELVALTRAFGAAWNAHEIDKVLAFLTDDIVFQMGPSPFTELATGKQQVRSFLVGVLRGFRVESWNYQASENRVTQMFKHSTDYFKSMGIDEVEGRAEAVFRGDKIESFIGTLSPQTVEKLWAALT